MIAIRIHLTARPDKEVELMQVAGCLAERIELESGCTMCELYQNTRNQNEFVVLQEWENEELVRAHLGSDNLAVLVGAGSILAHHVCVSLGKEQSTRLLDESFKRRMVEKKHL